jgi:methionine synthase II (cobalamin-independent)
MRNLQPFLDGLAEAGVARESAFWSLPSPGTLALFCEDRFFDGDHTKYVTALAQAVKPEYEAIAATGIKIQIDCPDLAMGRHTRYVNLTDAEFDAVAAANVKALNASLANVPREQVRIHVCWGNYAGPHHLDLSAYSVWPHVANCNAKYVLIEGANPRHGHEAAAFEHAVSTGLIDPTKFVVVPGVIDTTAARVEHPSLVAERLLRFVRAAGHPSRVIASTDCGFASTARSVAITADLAWRKIEALVEGAALATKLYLEAHAPVPTKMPSLLPTPYRVAVIAAGARSAATQQLVACLGTACSSVDVIPASGDSATAAKTAFEVMRWAVDFPIALLALGDSPANVALATLTATQTAQLLRADTHASRRPMTVFACGKGAPRASGVIDAGDASDAKAVCDKISSMMLDGTGFDRRLLAPGTNPAPLPDEVEVVVVGGGLLGMAAASRLIAKGHSVVILEQRALVGGIWSMHANSTSQVNSSEGGYCLKEFLPESSPRKHQHNRDHSTAAEVLQDLAALGDHLQDVIHTQVQVVQVIGTNGDYHIVCTQKGGAGGAGTKVIKCAGVVLAINDRVGMPRSLKVPGMDEFKGTMADGTSDQLTGVNWKGKRVVVFGMGAFAVENVRTALESGAAHVTVVARRLGTVCPKMIDYLNFVKPWDEHYRHETSTNVKQLKAWRDTYKAAGAVTPEVWPGKIKHDGHTISVSDIWFIAHKMGKMCTTVGALERMCADGCVLSDGSMLPCDIVVGCIGFERNTTFCEQLTGRTEVMYSNYLDKNMIYLADAEIDESAFNSFFGSSVLEYAKFYTNVFVEGLERPDKLGPILWGPQTARGPVKLRKWTQYIAVGAELIEKDAACKQHAASQVSERTKHFYRTMPPQSFVEVNRKE